MAGWLRPDAAWTCTTRSRSRYCSQHSRQESAKAWKTESKRSCGRWCRSSRPAPCRYFVNLSSATIRSELAELADLGYLAQPHTSSGRIPTDSGYRYFVDFLMDLEDVPERVRVYINDELRHGTADVQGLVERVAMTTASVTQNASVASAPHGAQGRIKHVDLVSLEPKEVLLILLLEGNLLRQQVVQVTDQATQPTLTVLASKFNESLVGKAGEEVRRQYETAALE